jgi:hypothetical protein
MRNSGAQFVAAGVATKHLLENLCAPGQSSSVTVYKSASQQHSRKSRVSKTGEPSEQSA